MNDSDKRLFMEILLAACAVYDKPPMEKAALQLYWKTLSRFSVGQIESAVSLHIERSKFFPKPADLIEIIDGTASGDAHEIWARIISNLERGRYDLSDYDEKAQRALQAIGGIKQLGVTGYEVLDFKRTAFLTEYKAAAESFARKDVKQIGRDEAKELLRNLNLPKLPSGEDLH